MPIVSKPNGDFVNNVDVADATKVNAQMNTIYNAVNGGLNSANVPTLGDVTTLTTTANNTAVAAINEINANYPIQFMNRQALINGNLDIWQRGTSFSPSTTASLYTADRWVLDANAAGSNYTVSRQDGTGVGGSRYCLRFARNNAVTNINNRAFRQGIETANAILLRGKKLTFSFWARCGANYSPTSSILNIGIQTGTGIDEPPAAFTGVINVATSTVTLTTSWQKFTLTTSAPIASTVNEINVTIFDTPVGTAGANDYYEITQGQIIAGDVALPFQTKSFAEELQLCQRYYWKTFPYATAPVQNTGVVGGAIQYVVHASGAIYDGVMVSFPVRMRTTPTITTYNPSAANNKWRNITLPADSGTVSTNQISDTGFLCVNNPQVAGDLAGHTIATHATADADL